MDFVQNVQNGKMGVLTFGNEYAKMQPTRLGFIVPVLLFLICLRSEPDYVYCYGKTLM